MRARYRDSARDSRSLGDDAMGRGVARRVRIKELLAGARVGEPVEVTGWVKTSRFSKNVSFVHVFDGSSTASVQVILDPPLAERYAAELGLGAAVRIAGKWKTSEGGEQAVEVLAECLEIVGRSDPTTYPIQKKRTTLEHLRTIGQFRPRTNTFQSVFRVRNALSDEVHRFFQSRGFLWIHTPIITSSDAEGAGELFQVISTRAAEGEDPKTGFFGKSVYLTVSGQLEVEAFAEAFTDVYTFGPTFRAENSNTARHAAEFWMIEPEIAFADLDDLLALAEEFIREVTLATIERTRDDFAFFDKHIESGVVEAVTNTVQRPFARITYTEAQEILARSNKSFEFPIGWGASLQAEHERYLAEEHVKGPVFVTDYPIEQKAFYMRVNDDQKTVAATDLLVPRIGEIIGGSQREERLEVLEAQMRKRGMDPGHLQHYLDLRRFGSVPHGGFGLGLERMLMWMTGMQNIRDVIPHPRTPGNAQ
jgi:asparaginyl-tRNA synthetase